LHNNKFLGQYTVVHNLTNSLTCTATFFTINIITLRVTSKSVYKSLLTFAHSVTGNYANVIKMVRRFRK